MRHDKIFFIIVKCSIAWPVQHSLFSMAAGVLLVFGNASAEPVKFHSRDPAMEVANSLQAEGKPAVVQALIRLSDRDSRQFEARGSVTQLDRLAGASGNCVDRDGV